MKREICFFALAIVMLANGALFTWLFSGGVLGMWRQGIWIAGSILMAFNFKRLYSWNPDAFNIVKMQMWFFLFMFVFAMFTWILQGFNLLRLAYALWIYFNGVPFLLLPCLLKWHGISPRLLFGFFSCLGVFLSAGILLDFVWGGTITATLGVAFKSADAVKESGRYCFLAEAPTTFSVYYCFCMISSLWRMYESRNQLWKVLSLFASLMCLLGAWLTGSRQMVAVLVGTWCVSLGFYFLFVRDKKRSLAICITVLMLSATSITAFLYKDSSFQNRYSSKTIAKDNRTIMWNKGYSDTFGSPEWGVFLWGKGVGMTQGQRAQKGESVGSHYENTFFSRMSDVGFIGIVILVYPFFFFLRRASIHCFADVLLFCFFASYLFVCFVSPNGSHQTTQMAIFLALGIVSNKEYFFMKENELVLENENNYE